MPSGGNGIDASLSLVGEANGPRDENDGVGDANSLREEDGVGDRGS
jgi:hypothetical protein